MKNKKLFLSACMLASIPLLSMTAEEARLLRFPSTNGSEIVFSYAGDLYRVSVNGGEAQRLTSHVGYEMFPRFSPDGKTIAFTGQYDGNTEVYTVPAEGGEPLRITYTATNSRDDLGDRMGPNNIVMNWTPDGNRIVYRNRMGDGFSGKLYTVDKEGGLSDVIPLPEGGLVVFGELSLFSEYLFLRLLRESTLHGLCHEAAIRALLSLLFCELARGEAQESAGSLPFYGEYFESELKHASLTHFARTFGYTPAYASRLVKRQTGKSFSELLSGYRMRRAAELLSSSDLSIEDIALEIGYQVPSALYKQFSAHFGMTPNEYRNALSG